ncbi:MAG: ATPase, partial [Syntrophomonadaceae bacterium]|nr:ATPase [Syntrophomonadaceae bacterium]
DCGLSPLGIVNSNDTPREVIYEQCKAIISQLEEKTRNLLQEEVENLSQLAAYLLAEESIDRETFLQMQAS